MTLSKTDAKLLPQKMHNPVSLSQKQMTKLLPNKIIITFSAIIKV